MWLVDLVLGPFLPYIAAAVAGLGAFLAGRSSGTSKEKRKQAEASAERAKQAREINDEVRKSSNDDVRADLDEWMRDE